ncbi:hypothetical protein ACFQX8_03680 [Klenkia terrae]|uniref:hypothetical protein n=1 Tax=Klenkia terrae TaxID=1052259 RepID=UPI00360BE44A
MTTFAAVAAPFGRDLDASFARIEGLVADARARGVELLALPEATLGGYLASLGDHGVSEVLPEHALPPPWTSTARRSPGWPGSPATWW